MGWDRACLYELEEARNRTVVLGAPDKATSGAIVTAAVGGRRCVRRLDPMYLPVQCQANLSHKMGSHPSHFTMPSLPLVECELLHN